MFCKSWMIGVALLGLVSLPAVSQSRAPLTAIVGAKLVDGLGGTPVEDSVVIVENGRIRAAGPRARVSIPNNATRVDAAGKTVIPGLIDAHCHYAAPVEDLKKYLLVQLKWGVTSSRSTGTDDAAHVALLHDARDGKFLAPRVYTSGFGFSHPKGAPGVSTAINRPANVDEARTAVAKLASQKVDFIKVWVEGGGGGTTPKVTPEIRAAIVDEARKHNIPIVTHVTAVEDLRAMAALGVTDMMHTPRDSEATPELIAFAKAKGLTFTPTQANGEAGWYYYERPELLKNPLLEAAFYPRGWARVTDPAAREKALADPNLAQRKENRKRGPYQFIKAMSDAGVIVATGTDTGAELAPVPFGAATLREVEIFVEAGLTPLKALRAATYDAARVLTRSANPEFGSIQAGKVADLVILDADPTADIHNIHRIHKVMRDGIWVP